MPSTAKISWQGRIISVQPRISLLRSFDQRQHSYQGYVLVLAGTIGDEQREFSIALGKVIRPTLSNPATAPQIRQ